MKVKDLISALSSFNGDDIVVIGKVQNYGSDYAYHIDDVIDADVIPFRGGDYRACLILESGQTGTFEEV